MVETILAGIKQIFDVGENLIVTIYDYNSSIKKKTLCVATDKKVYLWDDEEGNTQVRIKSYDLVRNYESTPTDLDILFNDTSLHYRITRNNCDKIDTLQQLIELKSRKYINEWKKFRDLEGYIPTTENDLLGIPTSEQRPSKHNEEPPIEQVSNVPKSEKKRKKKPFVIALLVIASTALLTFGFLQVINMFTADYKEQQAIAEKQQTYDTAIEQRELAASAYQMTQNELNKMDSVIDLINSLDQEFGSLELSDKSIQWIEISNTYNNLKLSYEDLKETMNDLPEAFTKSEAYYEPYQNIFNELSKCIQLADGNLENKFAELITLTQLQESIDSAKSAAETCIDILDNEQKKMRKVIQSSDEIIVSMGGQALLPNLDSDKIQETTKE